jgi:hypothetical protein
VARDQPAARAPPTPTPPTSVMKCRRFMCPSQGSGPLHAARDIAHRGLVVRGLEQGQRGQVRRCRLRSLAVRFHGREVAAVAGFTDGNLAWRLARASKFEMPGSIQPVRLVLDDHLLRLDDAA